MTNLQIGDKVNVTISMAHWGKEDMVFESTVMDIAKTAVWVDHPELRGEDWLLIAMDENLNNKVEVIEEVKVDRRHDKAMDLKDAHKAINKAFKWVNEDIKVMVKVYDCFDDNSNWEQFDDEQSYDVEISWAIGEDVYTDCLVTDSFYSNIEGDEVAEKDAISRAKSVLRTVKGWFSNHDQVTVVDGIEVYHQ
jgi:hypothetical protein